MTVETVANDTTNGDVSEDSNDNDVSKGSGVDNTQNNQVEKKYTDKDFDDFVKRKTPELESRIKTKLEKQYEGKLILTEQERDDLIKEAVLAAIKEKDLEVVKKTIQTEYGLNDAQVARLTGDDDKSLREDAELVFGALKKRDAPKLSPGNKTVITGDESPNAELNAWLSNNNKKRH